jgi:hypothetical protein
MRAGIGDLEVSKYKNKPLSSSAAVEISFSEPSLFLLMTISDSPLLGQFASGLNFYDDSGRRLLAD